MAEPRRGMNREPNEGDWLHGQMPSMMIYYVAKLATDRRIEFHLSVKAAERKLRLFYCACSRWVWPMLEGVAFRNAVEVCERYLDTRAEKSELRTALQGAEEALKRAKTETQALGWSGVLGWQNWELNAAMNLPILAATATINSARRGMTQEGGPVKQLEQVALLKELFANPFRPAAVDAVWLTPAVVQLARAAYDDREFPAGTLDAGCLSVLADALEEVGCDDPDILGHLRGPGPHVRGCWVVDQLLGME